MAGRRDEGVAAAYLVAAMFFWGTAFRATAIAAEDASATMVSALRAAPAALVLLALFPLFRARLPRGELWLWAAVSGVLAVPLTLIGIAEGTTRAGAGNAAVLVNTTPFFVLVFGRLFLGERVSRTGLAGIVIGFTGVVVMVSTQLGGDVETGSFLLGMALALAGAVGWGASALIVKWRAELDPSLDVLGLSVAQYLVGAPILAALAFGLEGTGGTDWSSTGLWGASAWLAVGSSVVGSVAFLAALKRISATRAVAWGFLAPVVAVVVEIVYGNTPETIVLVGMALAIAGVALANLAPQLPRVEPRRLGRRSRPTVSI